jgi:hypothetical protein
MGLLGVICSLFIVRIVDRRKIVLYGCLACGIFQLIPAIVWSAKPASSASGKVVVAFITLFTFSYVLYG